MTAETSRPNIFYIIAAIAGAAFAVTILVMLATVFGDADAPMNDVIDRWSGWFLTVEVVVTISSALIALSVDRHVASSTSDADHEMGEQKSELSSADDSAASM